MGRRSLGDRDMGLPWIALLRTGHRLPQSVFRTWNLEESFDTFPCQTLTLMTLKMSINTSVLSEERRVDEETLIQPALSTCGRLKQLAPAQTDLVAGIIWLQCKIIANARTMILRADTNGE